MLHAQNYNNRMYMILMGSGAIDESNRRGEKAAAQRWMNHGSR
jgi:hypothetical protein